MLVAEDSGNRFFETQLGYWLCGFEAEQGNPVAALKSLDTAIRNNYESGNIGMLPNPLAILAGVLDRLGRYQPAATMTGFAAINPMAAVTMPELRTRIAHLRAMLGDQIYESLTRSGKSMTISAIVTYAHDQIDQARTEATDEA